MVYPWVDNPSGQQTPVEVGVWRELLFGLFRIVFRLVSFRVDFVQAKGDLDPQ